MYLIIDTTDADSITIALFEKKLCIVKKVIPTKKSLEDLLVNIDGLLRDEKKTIKNISAIAINEGPGSFTGLRVGITTSNLIASSLDIPIFPYHQLDVEKAAQFIFEKCDKEQKFTQPVCPKYLKKL